MSDTSWKIIFVPEAEKEFFKLDRQVQQQIQQYLKKKITTSLNPRRFGKQLRRNLSDIWCYRVSNYRLLCSIKDKELIVLVVHIGHRRKVYQ